MKAKRLCFFTVRSLRIDDQGQSRVEETTFMVLRWGSAWLLRQPSKAFLNRLSPRLTRTPSLCQFLQSWLLPWVDGRISHYHTNNTIGNSPFPKGSPTANEAILTLIDIWVLTWIHTFSHLKAVYSLILTLVLSCTFLFAFVFRFLPDMREQRMSFPKHTYFVCFYGVQKAKISGVWKIDFKAFFGFTTVFLLFFFL